MRNKTYKKAIVFALILTMLMPLGSMAAENAADEGISKVYSKIFHSGNRVKPFCTYGCLDETIGVRSIPSLSLILATNLVYCNNREINNM